MSTPGGSHDGVDISASHQTNDRIEMSAREHKRQHGYVKANITREVCLSQTYDREEERG